MAGEINFGALQTPDYFGNALRAQALGQQAGLQTQRRNALSGYSSDPTGTISQLATIDPEAAQNLSRVHQADVAATARAKASKQYAGGDSAGAQATALGAGDSEMLTAIAKMDDQGRTQAKERAGNLASVAYGLRSLPYEARKAQLSQLAPRAADLGMTPEAIQGFDPTDGNIDAVVNKSLGVKELIDRHDKLSKPVEMDPAKNYFLPDEAGAPPAPAGQGGQGGQSGQGGGVAPASTPGAPAAPAGGNLDAVWSAVKQQESGGNGNAVGPQTPYGQAQGSTQMLMPTAEGMARKLGVAWNPSLMRGDTPRALAYQDMLGKAYFQEGLDKYGGDVTKALAYYHGGPNEQLWGPKTQAYVQAVTGRLQGGGGADTLQGGAQPYEVAANGETPPPPSMPGYHLVQAGRPQWQSDGKGGLINPATGDRKKDPTFAGAGTQADPNIVKGLIEGRITPPTQKAAASDYWQAQLQAAAEQDPNFDMVNFQARSKTRADFTSGKSATNITALNTVIGHLDHLDRTIDGLGNTGPGGALNFGPLNSLNNKAARLIANQSGGDVRYKDFETAKTAVANELTRVFRGTGGAEADIQGWMKQLESAGSPEALHGVVRSMAELINSRVEALGEQYSQGMGTTRDPLTLLTPDKQKAFTRLMGGSPADAAPAQGGAQPAGQGGALPPQAAAQLKAGHTTTFANGQSWTLRNGQPARLR